MSGEAMEVRDAAANYAPEVKQDVPPGYKRTEVGVIPEDWVLDLLRNVVEFLDEKRKPIKSSEREKIAGIYPYYGASGVVDYVSDYIFDDELILLGEDGENILSRNLPLAFKVSGKVWVNNHAHVLRPKAHVNIDYLTAFLESLDYSQYNSGTAQPKLNKRTCAQIPVLLPPQHEQRAIATALSDVDALITALDRLIAKKRAIKTAAMQQLLTGKTRLPGFTGEWETKRLGDVLTVCHGRNQSQVESSDGPFPILASGGRIGNATRPLYDKPSVLIGRKGTIDRPQYMDTPFWTVDTLFYTAMKDDNVAKFFYYRFCLIDWMQYNEASGVPSLNSSTIERIEISSPPPEEQTAIAQVLSDMDAEIAALEACRDKTRAIKQGMMQQLLTGRVRLVKPGSKEAA